MADHRLILSAHAQALLGVSASAASTRLRSLASGGFVASRRIFHDQPAAHQITRVGLQAIGSQLRRPRIDLRCYQHDVDLAWLWLIARSGKFGQLRQVLSERQLRSQDGHPSGSEPFGIRLGGSGPHGRPRLHYPDLMLITPQGRRVAVELELSSKGAFRRERILAGYGSDARVAAALYLVKDRKIAGSIQASARRLGISSLVHVQWARSAPPAAGMTGARASERAAVTRARATEHAAARSPSPEAVR